MHNAGLTQTCNRLLTPGCVCFENITYECSVTGGNYTVTVWRVVNGLLSNSCEISLNHNQFENNGAVQIQCDSSTMLRLQAIRRESNCYISQLAIIPGPTGPFSFLNGGSIQCFVRHGMLIGTTALIISSRSKYL